jgi:hypothetical protein
MANGSEIIKARNHTHQLILSKDVQKNVHGDGPIGKFNTFFAVKITQIVGSMWCAYIFVLLTLISLPAAIASHNTIVIVSWIAQTFLQLVLLPIIIVGQNVQAAASDERAIRDHETLNAIHTLSSEIFRINEQQNNILDLLEKKK